MLEFSSKSNSNVVEKGLLSTATQTSSNAYSGCCRGIGYFTRSFSFDLSSWCAAKILRDHNSKRAGSFDAPEFFTALKLHIVTFSCLPAHLFASPQEVVGGREAAHWVMTERLPVRQFRRRSYWLSFRRHTSQFAQGKCWSRDFARLMQRIAGETEANSLFMRERAPPTMQHICGLSGKFTPLLQLVGRDTTQPDSLTAVHTSTQSVQLSFSLTSSTQSCRSFLTCVVVCVYHFLITSVITFCFFLLE